MSCTLLVEQIENRWIAHALELPGCFSSGDSSHDAVVGSAPATAIWMEWLVAHDLAIPGNTGPLVSEVIEIVPAWRSRPDYEVNAFFAADRPALSNFEIERGLKILDGTRLDLFSAVREVPYAQFDLPVEDNWSIGGILKHVARAELWYLDRLDLGFPLEDLPENPFEALIIVRRHFRQQLATLAGDDRLATKDFETWTPRKMLRRALWHERDHTDHALQFRKKLDA